MMNSSCGMSADAHVNFYEGPEELARTIAPLTPGQRALLALKWCVIEVYNGGFDQFFTNSAGALSQEALDGARRIGARQTADLLVRAYGIFPDGVPPFDRDEREDFLRTLSHDERANYTDALERFSLQSGVRRASAAAAPSPCA